MNIERPCALRAKVCALPTITGSEIAPRTSPEAAIRGGIFDDAGHVAFKLLVRNQATRRL